jgi:hypothetical protein
MLVGLRAVLTRVLLGDLHARIVFAVVAFTEVRDEVDAKPR